jgi:hypothetical protein
MKKTRKKESFRDATIDDLRKVYPNFIVTPGRDSYSFSIKAKRLDFKNDSELGDFHELISQNDARYTFIGSSEGIEVIVSNYTGFMPED